jgi:hypothetical protein
MIKLTSHGSFKNTQNFLKRAKRRTWADNLKKYAEEGLSALRVATPKDTGKTADSWTYEINVSDEKTEITWVNTNRTDGKNGPPIVVLLYYGHAMPHGGYCPPNDFMTPVMEPIFKKIADDAWKELTKR